MSEASVEAARRGAGDPTTNASGARLLASLEPPTKPKDAFWGGSDSSAEADAAADADPKGALEKILKGKSGMAMCVQLLLVSQRRDPRCARCLRKIGSGAGASAEAVSSPGALHGIATADAAAWEPPSDEEAIHSLKDLFAKRPPARDADIVAGAGELASKDAAACSCGGGGGGSSSFSEVLVAAGYENGHVYVLDSGLERSDDSSVTDKDGSEARRADAVADADGRRELPSVDGDACDDDEQLFLSRMGRRDVGSQSAADASATSSSEPDVAAAAAPAARSDRRRFAVGRFRSRTDPVAAGAGGAGAGRPLRADAPSSAGSSRALVSLQIGRQPILALAISSDCRRGVAGSAEAAVAVFSLDIPAGTGALLHRVPLPLAGTSAACILAAASVAPTEVLHTGLWAGRGAPSARLHDVGVTAGWDGTVRLVQLGADSSAESYSDAAAAAEAVSSGLVTALRNAHGSTVYGVAAWPTPLRSVLADAAGVADAAMLAGAAMAGAGVHEGADGNELDDLLADGPFGGSPLSTMPAETRLTPSHAPSVAVMVAAAAKDGTITVYRL